jgi:transcriptional regulator with XRE-family HTH domain
MTTEMAVGGRIRKLRRTQGRSIYEIAAASGITPSLVSKIETGRSNPPVATLTRIAKALGVTTSSLLDDSVASRTIYTPGDGVKPDQMTVTDKGYRFLALAAGRHDKAMQVFVFEGEKGKVKKQALSHTGEELVFMLDGEMLYSVGSVQYRMKAGDSLYFDAEEDHDVEPLTKKVRYLAVFVERTKPTRSNRKN